jgi:hypothetical protein
MGVGLLSTCQSPPVTAYYLLSTILHLPSTIYSVRGSYNHHAYYYAKGKTYTACHTVLLYPAHVRLLYHSIPYHAILIRLMYILNTLPISVT